MPTLLPRRFTDPRVFGRRFTLGASTIPGAVGSIGTLRVQKDTGDVTVDLSGYFSGPALVFSEDGGAGVSINSSTGVLTIDTDALAQQTLAFTVTATNDDGEADQAVTLLVGAQIGFSVPYSDYFTWTSGQRASEIARMAAAGATWVRIDAARNTHESSGPTYTWGSLDDAHTRITGAGMKMLPIIRNTATYAGQDVHDWPTDKANWKAFCTEVVDHFSPEKVEIWNEPNLATFANDFDDPSGFVARVLQPAYEAVKAEDSSVAVISGGLSPSPAAPTDGVSMGAKAFFEASFGVGNFITDLATMTWATQGGSNTTMVHQGSGVWRLTNTAATGHGRRYNFATVVGRTYRVKGTIGSAGSTAGGVCRVRNNTGTLYANLNGGNCEQYGPTPPASSSFDFYFVANETNSYVFIATNTSTNGHIIDLTLTVDSVWDPNIGECCDSYGMHPYYWYYIDSAAEWATVNNSYGPEMQRDMRAYAVAQSKTKPFRMTEFGGPTTGTSPDNALSEADQAAMMLEAWDASAGAETWIECIDWYTWADRGGGTTDTENWYGVVGPASGGFVAKAALATISVIMRGA